MERGEKRSDSLRLRELPARSALFGSQLSVATIVGKRREQLREWKRHQLDDLGVRATSQIGADQFGAVLCVGGQRIHGRDHLLDGDSEELAVVVDTVGGEPFVQNALGAEAVGVIAVVLHSIGYWYPGTTQLLRPLDRVFAGTTDLKERALDSVRL